MWCQSVRRNLAARMPSTCETGVDFIDLQWHECRQAMKTRTVGGEPINVLLPAGQQLRHGDVVYEDQRTMVVVRVAPCELVVATPRDCREMAILAMELGNLHLDAEIGDGEISFVPDPRAIEVLDKLCSSWKHERRRFAPTRMMCAPAVSLNANLRVIRSRPKLQ